ncbi:MAG: TIM barrel protein [Planctomycetia bacterium]|nr:TIM barrel protein [Planctomycetia bacterium]
MFKCLSPAPLGLTSSLNDLIEPALSHGFKGLELDIVTFQAQVAQLGLPGARRLIESAQLKLGYFRLPWEIESPVEIYRPGLNTLKEQAALAAELGCKRCLTTLAPANDERPLHQNFVFHQERLKATAEILSAHGIELGVGFCATPEPRGEHQFEFIRNFNSLQLLLGMVGAKNVGVVVDLFELWACGSSWDDVAASRAKVTAVFLADVAAEASPEEARQNGRLLPAETSTIDSVAPLTALAELRYDGPVVALPHADRFKGVSRAAACKLTGEKLEEVWKSAGLTPVRRTVALKK